jgi:hypothetical protein
MWRCKCCVGGQSIQSGGRKSSSGKVNEWRQPSGRDIHTPPGTIQATRNAKEEPRTPCCPVGVRRRDCYADRSPVARTSEFSIVKSSA